MRNFSVLGSHCCTAVQAFSQTAVAFPKKIPQSWDFHLQMILKTAHLLKGAFPQTCSYYYIIIAASRYHSLFSTMDELGDILDVDVDFDDFTPSDYDFGMRLDLLQTPVTEPATWSVKTNLNLNVTLDAARLTAWKNAKTYTSGRNASDRQSSKCCSVSL